MGLPDEGLGDGLGDGPLGDGPLGDGPPDDCAGMGRMALYHISRALGFFDDYVAGSDARYHLQMTKKYIERLNKEGARFSAFVKSQPTDRKALTTKLCRQRKQLRRLQKLYKQVVDENNLIEAALRRMTCRGCSKYIGSMYNMHTFCLVCANKLKADDEQQTT